MTAPPRILEVVADGNPGGGTSNVLALAADLRRMTNAEILFATQAHSFALSAAQGMGVESHGIDFFRPRRFSPDVFLAVRRLVKAVKPDLIHVHGGRAAFYFAPLRPTLSVPLLYTVRGFRFLEKPGIHKYIAAAAEWMSGHAADVNLFVSRQDEGIARAWGFVGRGKSSQVIYNGISPADMPAPQERDPKLLGYLGRLAAEKNPMLPVAVLDLLRARGYRLKIIGGGPMQQAVAERVAALGLSDRVEMTGAVDRQRALAELNSIGCLIFPSFAEGFPLAPLEAMWLKIPVVCSDLPCNREIVESGRTGLVMDDFGAASFAAAVDELASAPDRRAAIVNAARDAVEQRFMRAATHAAHVDLYGRILGHERVVAPLTQPS